MKSSLLLQEEENKKIRFKRKKNDEHAAVLLSPWDLSSLCVCERARQEEEARESEMVLTVPRCSSVSNCVSAIRSICFFHLQCMSVCSWGCRLCMCVCVRCCWFSPLWSEARGWAVALSWLRVSPNTSSYSWPDQFDVTPPPSISIWMWNMLKEKEKKKSRVPGSHRTDKAEAENTH